MKKAQIRLFESIAVLLVFSFLIAIGLKFYTNVQMQSLEEAEKKFSKLDSVKTVVTLSNLPELACSTEGIFDNTCIDNYKLQAWMSIMREDIVFKDHYYYTLGDSLVFINQTYPMLKEIFEIYNMSLDNAQSDYMMSPKNIYNPITGDKTFAILNVRTYYE